MKVTAGAIDITPDARLVMGSTGNVIGQSGTERLEVGLIAIRGDDGEAPLVLSSIDTLYPGSVLSHALNEVCSQFDNRSTAIIGASHTHGAPMLDSEKPKLGKADRQYLQRTETSLRELAGSLLQEDGTSAEVFVGKANARHSINRRRKKRLIINRAGISLNGVANAPNPIGVTDEEIVICEFRSLSGRPQCIIWNYACHPVAHPDDTHYTSHYPSVVREAMRSKYNDPELPVLFFQGFSGNTRPSVASGARSWKKRLQRLLTGPVFDRIAPSEYSHWSQSLTSRVGSTPMKKVDLGDFVVKSTRLDASKFSEGAENVLPVIFRGVHFARDLSLFSVSAELMAEYGRELRMLNPERSLLLVSCTDSPFGYLPTNSMMRDGGYEVHGFTPFFGIGKLRPGIEKLVLRAFKQVSTPPLMIPTELNND